MTGRRPRRRRLPLALIFAIGIVLVTALAVALAASLIQPPPRELAILAGLLAATAAFSIAAGYGAYRLGWFNRSPRLRWSLLGGYALASTLTFVNVWMAALLMFTSRHDLLLATVLLTFASGIAVCLGYFLSTSMMNRLASLNEAATRLAQGDLDARVDTAGRDEIADLACTFNDMATRLQQAARQQEELDTLRRELVAWVGHDVRTPLASLRAVLDALADGYVESPEAIANYLATAQQQVLAMAALLDDLSELAQIDAGGLILDREPNSLGDLISDTIEAMSPIAARKSIRLEGSAAVSLDPVRMDARLIGRVLANVLDNALRHTPPGGRVHITAFRAAETARVEVRDSGEGIAAHDLPHVFERFYRGEPSRNRDSGGAGLGLAIARGVVEAHGGHIGIESTPGAGTLVWFELPR